MPRESEKKTSEIKAGMFIIISLSLIVFSLLWLKYFTVRPAMTIVAKFKNPSPVSKGLPVYYQGVNIGKISDVDFTSDYKYTLIHIQIVQKDLNLPSNIYAEVKAEGITGQKYIDISYPDQPSGKLLSDGTIIPGKSPFSISDIQDFFGEQVKSGRMEKIFANLERTMANTNAMSKKLNNASSTIITLLDANKADINTFFSQGAKASRSISNVAANIDDLIDNPQAKESFRTTIKSTASTAKNIDKLLGDEQFRNNIRDTVNGINSTVKSLNETFMKANTAIEGANEVFMKTSKVIDGVNQPDIAVAPESKNLIVKTVNNINEAAKRFNCVNQGVSDMLSKRFLLIRLMFGKPGNSLEKCKNCTQAAGTPKTSTTCNSCQH